MKKYLKCKHIFHSVYYGSEWEVECKNCDIKIRDVYQKESMIRFVNSLINTRIVQKGGLFYPQYKEKYRNLLFQKKEKWKIFKVWDEGGFDLIGIPSDSGHKECEGFFTKECCEEFIQKELEKQIFQIYE